jgi:hypothetical protein
LDHDGFVSRHEFPVLIDYIEYFGRLWEKFEQLDKDCNGTVSQAEFVSGFRVLDSEAASLSKKQVVVLFRQLDNDGSEAVSFDEFCKWMAKRYIDRLPNAPKKAAKSKAVADTDARRPKPPRGRKPVGGRTAKRVTKAPLPDPPDDAAHVLVQPAAHAPADPASTKAAPTKPAARAPADPALTKAAPTKPAAPAVPAAPALRRGVRKQPRDNPKSKKPKISAEELAAAATAAEAEAAAAAYALRAPVRRFAGERSSASVTATKASAPSFGLTREERRVQRAAAAASAAAQPKKSKGHQKRAEGGEQRSRNENGTKLPSIGQHAQSARDARAVPAARQRIGKHGAQTARGAPRKQQHHQPPQAPPPPPPPPQQQQQQQQQQQYAVLPSYGQPLQWGPQQGWLPHQQRWLPHQQPPLRPQMAFYQAAAIPAPGPDVGGQYY